MSAIKLIDIKVNRDELKSLVDEGFKDMVKPDIGRHLTMFRSLLLLTPESANQIP